MDKDDAAGFLDGLDAQRPVGPSSRKNDCKAVAVLPGQRPKEKVDRRTPATRLIEWQRRDVVVGDAQPTVRRYHINIIAFEPRRVLDLGHPHRRAAREDVGEFASRFRIQVQDNNEGRTGFGGQGLEKSL